MRMKALRACCLSAGMGPATLRLPMRYGFMFLAAVIGCHNHYSPAWELSNTKAGTVGSTQETPIRGRSPAVFPKAMQSSREHDRILLGLGIEIERGGLR